MQIDSEVIRVEAVANGGTQYQVTRAMHSSAAAAHAAQAAVYTLQNKTVIAAFPSNFFGSPYSGSWSQACERCLTCGWRARSCSSPTCAATVR